VVLVVGRLRSRRRGGGTCGTRSATPTSCWGSRRPPWPAGPKDQRRDQIIYYQYRADRARRTPHGIDEQVAKAEQAVAGKTAVKRNWFIQKRPLVGMRGWWVHVVAAKATFSWSRGRPDSVARRMTAACCSPAADRRFVEEDVLGIVTVGGVERRIDLSNLDLDRAAAMVAARRVGWRERGLMVAELTWMDNDVSCPAPLVRDRGQARRPMSLGMRVYAETGGGVRAVRRRLG